MRSKLTFVILFIFFIISIPTLHAQQESEAQQQELQEQEELLRQQELEKQQELQRQKEAKKKQKEQRKWQRQQGQYVHGFEVKELFSWALHGSIFYFPAVNGVDADPAPILPSGGASFAFQLAKLFKLELTEDFYFTNYEYNAELSYPMACNPENRSAFVMGFLTGINAVFYLPFGNHAFRLFGGPAFDLRIIALAVGLNHPADFTGDIKTDAQLQTDAIKKYFWEKGRWFMPAVGFGFDFLIRENLCLGFDFRTWFPMYKLWAEDNTSSIDGWRFGIGLRITFK